MNLSFEWKITNVIKKAQVNGLDNVLVRVVYEYKGTDADSGMTYTMLGGLDLGAPSGDNFTAITDLTQEQVISWMEVHPDVPKLQRNIEGAIKSAIDRSDETLAEEITWLETNQPIDPATEEDPVDQPIAE